MANLDQQYCDSLVGGQLFPLRYLGSYPHMLYYSPTDYVPIYSYSRPPVLSERIHGAYYKGGVLDRPLWDADMNVQSPVGRLEWWCGHHYPLTYPYVIESDAALQLPRFDNLGNPLPRRFGFGSVISATDGLPIVALALGSTDINPPNIWILEALSLRVGLLHCLEFDMLPVHIFIDSQRLYYEINPEWVTWRNLYDPVMMLVDELHALWSLLRGSKLATLTVVPRESIYQADYCTRIAPNDRRVYTIHNLLRSASGRFFAYKNIAVEPYIWFPRTPY
ncbi:hypothetical protein MKW92_009577 [Papaver armeniacum]|nr:hypothetical protein MKW92_009577 [Papaver armeniacum]